MARDTRESDTPNFAGKVGSESDRRLEKNPKIIYQFGPYQLDLGRHELRRSGRRLRVAPTPLALLALLIERHDVVVERKEIAARLWPQADLVNVEQAINTTIRRIREVLVDDPSHPRFVETIVGKGYCFVADVRKIESELQNVQPPTSALYPQTEVQGPSIPPPPQPPIEPLESSPAPPSRPKQGMRRLVLVGVAVSLVFAGAYAGWRHYKHSSDQLAASLTQVTTNDSEQRVTAAAISPDGKLVAYADATGISLLTLARQETVALKAPQNFQADKISWYPDQLKILVSGFDRGSAVPQIWTVFVTGLPPHHFENEARNGSPSPDGSRILFTTNKDHEIWIAGLEGDGARALVVSRSGEYFPVAFWSADGQRVSFLERRNEPDQGIYQSVDMTSGRILASEKGVTFDSACALKDGRILLLHNNMGVFGSAHVIWEVKSDPANGAFLSSPKTVHFFDKGRVSELTTSDDGSSWSVLIEKGEPHVYVGTLQWPGPTLAEVQRLTFDTRTDYPHAWLPDNQTVIFESNRSSRFAIYQQHLQDRTAQKLTTGEEPAVLPQVTPDGRWILFAMKPNVTPSSNDLLYRIPVSGGSPSRVAIGGYLDEFACPLSGKATCVLRETIGKQTFVYYALDPVTGKGMELARIAWLPHLLGNWSVSPDGSAIALPSNDPGRSTIRIVPLVRGRQEQDVVVKGFSNLAEVTWSADGQGWFVASNSAVGTALLYVDRQGNSHILRDTPLGTWGVPSPDGHKLAFVDQAVDSNVWVRQN